MGLSKAMLLVHWSHGDERIQVFFNPNEYSIQNSNQFSRHPIPGLPLPVTQYVNAESATLSMELFFDTYEAGTDVRDFTSRVTSLLEVDAGTKAPPICEFIWGSLHFKGVLENVTQKFTMFLETGTPVRATLSVTFRQFTALSEQVAGQEDISKRFTKQVVLQAGEALWSLAQKEFEDAGKWKDIASASGIDNPKTVSLIGAVLDVPKPKGLF